MFAFKIREIHDLMKQTSKIQKTNNEFVNLRSKSEKLKFIQLKSNIEFLNFELTFNYMLIKTNELKSLLKNTNNMSSTKFESFKNQILKSKS